MMLLYIWLVSHKMMSTTVVWRNAQSHSCYCFVLPEIMPGQFLVFFSLSCRDKYSQEEALKVL